MGSRGSIIPLFVSLAKTGELPITHPDMTRFMISLDQGVKLVWHAFEDMVGGEVYVKKIPSMKIIDVAKAVAPMAMHKIIGIRPGEKLHEQMISLEDGPYTYEFDSYYKILPVIHNWSLDPFRIKGGSPVVDGFIYASDTNKQWLSISQLQEWLKKNDALVRKQL
jgi:FlaA1/EpsC-like NDP-sugar epimerase